MVSFSIELFDIVASARKNKKGEIQNELLFSRYFLCGKRFNPLYLGIRLKIKIFNRRFALRTKSPDFERSMDIKMKMTRVVVTTRVITLYE